VFLKAVPKIIHIIETESNFDSTIYKPTFCRFDDNGNIYTIDYSTFYIHKYLNTELQKSLTHTIIGKGKGGGPGELLHPCDIEIYNNKLYISDDSKGRIIVYSPDGGYVNEIRFSDNKTPYKIVVDNEKIIAERLQFSSGKLFHVYDLNGTFLSAFGGYVNKTNRHNSVFHDNYIIGNQGGGFYYIPLYLGFIAYYNGHKVEFIKETIDGLKDVKTVKKEVIKGLYARKIDKQYITANSVSCNGKYLMITAIHCKANEEKKNFFDVYSAHDIRYLGSIEFKEYPVYFDLHGSILAGIYNGNIVVWDLSEVLKEAGRGF